MRVSTLLSALTTVALFDVALGGDPAWRRAKHNAHRRQYTANGNSGVSDYNSGSYDGASGTLAKVTGSESGLVRRFDGSRFSFYDAGLGACGIVNTGDDFIVALNSAQFDSGNYCFKKITITINGKSTQATVTDRCPGCPWGGLDFSRGLFKFFADESVGIIHGGWEFGGGAPPPPKKHKKPVVDLAWQAEPSAPPAAPPPPPPPPSPSPAPVTSSSNASTSTSTTQTSSSAASTSSTSGTPSAATPSSTWKPEEHKGCIENLDIAMVHLGGMIISGAKAGEMVKA